MIIASHSPIHTTMEDMLCKASASLSGAVRIRGLFQGRLDTGIEPANLRWPDRPLDLLSHCLPNTLHCIHVHILYIQTKYTLHLPKLFFYDAGMPKHIGYSISIKMRYFPRINIRLSLCLNPCENTFPRSNYTYGQDLQTHNNCLT